MNSHVNLLAIGLVSCVLVQAAWSQASDAELSEQFVTVVQPFLATYCCTCHDQHDPEAKLDLTVYRTVEQVNGALDAWEELSSRLKANEMPPAESKLQPSVSEKQTVIEWIRAIRRREALRSAGDPGIVLARRLSNAEYNYTIHDLTGVDIQPTREFPVDPANEAGFDNSGESLTMSPALLKKYLEAARKVAEHLVLTPGGFEFAPHPVVTDTDRDKYCVKRIVQFYSRQPTDYADYFLAAWRYRDRSPALPEKATIATLAETAGLSPRYLALVWKTLTQADSVGVLAKLQTMWNALPTDPSQIDQARVSCAAMRDFVTQVRRKLEPAFENLDVKGIHKGSQPFVLWKNGQYARHRRLYSHDSVTVVKDLPETTSAATDVEIALAVPESEPERRKYEAALASFCDVFPDAFYVSERGRDYEGKPRELQEKGRLLSAGFHSMMGYYRDDGPLMELILSDDQKRELDLLWQELDFVTAAPMRQYAGFVWFERTDSAFMRDPEFDFARAEDKSVTSEAMIRRLADVYWSKAKGKDAGDIPLQAIENYFATINNQIRWVEQARVAAEPKHLEALLGFATRAWRRELSATDREQLIAFYRSLRESEGLGHEDAIQDSLVAILMSPNFSYRLDFSVAGPNRRALTDIELASRLSYFLWSSAPDQQLMQLAITKELGVPEVLLSETHRMLKGSRSERFAIEFAGNWLDFRRFAEHNSVDRNRFPEFTDSLRLAMYEEPVRFFMDVVQQDRSVLDFFSGKHTFVNRLLARHYGMPESMMSDSEDWIRVDDASIYNRGGLLPMSIFLTKNSPGLRTSPVKRGYWVVRRLLGERIPPPPPNVPELPNDESQLGERTIREALASHREHSSCAGCHNRFDAIGLAFENYGPVGEQRKVDLGGHTIDNFAMFPDGMGGSGMAGLRDYMLRCRQNDFLDNLCRKLLCFALGRSLILSDDLLIERMRSRLESEGNRFGCLIETIVTSSQFLEKRGDLSTLVPIHP